MLIRIHPENPQMRVVKQVADVLRKGGIIIYPTDTLYGLGCDIFQHKAIERICQIKGINSQKAQLSFVCQDLSHLSEYAKQLSTPVYRTLKQHLPGPYTFILEASKQVPKLLKTKKDTVGIRVPDNKITRCIVQELGNPILSTSLPGEFVEDYTDPEIINDRFGKLVDLVIDGGIGGMVPSTIVDFTSGEPVMIREGAGAWEELSATI
ncbi:L-threonylcarbamoyladenylate synthase [Chitinophagaceae bacterium LB-8]|jgi:tRNA threonylcarbamoyl adenosine modification protein (Sua5/YciO/YrdC/YwlC family)|uniref:L-threonylcarbamoyladenylate synthase n=1 Tax=Paraflavisolibacter caeni TaxID=2982496 RepID=A0A9X2XY96_9BACT|nr:L-threonylcarbamoyladenylate synthase [Paraflavisolibacter caeni]MCU7551026.1 L-threonylcarbamoyladenylate synthase [Paraflavisolibacter caeni]